MGRKYKGLISLLLIVIIAISAVACSSQKDTNEKEVNPDEITSSTVEETTVDSTEQMVTRYIEVTDEDGAIKKDKDGNAITTIIAQTTKPSTTKKEKTTSKKKPTESTTHYTTVADDHNLPEDTFDEYVYTESSAMFFLQEYYGDKYIVNYDWKNTKGDNVHYAVFKVDDLYTIHYEVVVNILTGKATQKDMKTGKTVKIKI